MPRGVCRDSFQRCMRHGAGLTLALAGVLLSRPAAAQDAVAPTAQPRAAAPAPRREHLFRLSIRPAFLSRIMTVNSSWSGFSFVGGSLAVTLPNGLTSEASYYLSIFCEDYGVSAGYVLNHDAPGWHAELPIQLGYRRAIVMTDALGDSLMTDSMHIGFIGATAKLVRNWGLFGMEMGLYTNFGLPFSMERFAPLYSTRPPPAYWFDVGLFLGWTLAP